MSPALLLLAITIHDAKLPLQTRFLVRRQSERHRRVCQGNFHEHIPSQKRLIHGIMPLERMQIRPKILFVTSHWPLAAAYGAQQRVLNLGRLLSRFGEVSFLIVPTEQEDEE